MSIYAWVVFTGGCVVLASLLLSALNEEGILRTQQWNHSWKRHICSFMLVLDELFGLTFALGCGLVIGGLLGHVLR